MSNPIKILIAPLDWGLGHATRCIPIIHALLEREVKIIIGGSGWSGKLMQVEFPQLPYVEIPSYDVTYSSKLPMSITMLRQAPGILRAIQQEKKWLEAFIETEKIDVVISDNRYGMHNKNIYSIFISHQIFISSGSNDLLEPMLWKVNKSYIENFDMCWIPDMPGDSNASGKLSHKKEIPFNHQFIGLLSRLKAITNSKKTYTAAFILSGLEPLRTELENLIIQQSYELNEGKYILIRGANTPIQKHAPSNLEILDLGDSQKIEEIIRASEIVVSRAGYSSIMDYLVSNAKALLIPTPGQTEQEYLATYHLESNRFYSVEQAKMDLCNDLKLGITYQPEFTNNPKLLEMALDELIKSIN